MDREEGVGCAESFEMKRNPGVEEYRAYVNYAPGPVGGTVQSETRTFPTKTQAQAWVRRVRSKVEKAGNFVRADGVFRSDLTYRQRVALEKKKRAPKRNPESVLEQALDIAERLKSLPVPYVSARVSQLGGAHRAATMVAVSLDPRESWSNGIFENSRHAKFSVNPEDGTIEQLTGWKVPKFRKARFKTPAEAVAKIAKWAKEGSETKANPRKRASKANPGVPSDCYWGPRSNPSKSDYRVTVLYPSGAKRSYTSEHRMFGGSKPAEIAADEARKGANGTIIEVRESNVGRPGGLLYRYEVVGYGVVRNAPKEKKANPKKRNPRKPAIRWQDMKLSPDQNVGGAGSSWYVFSHGQPVSQHRTREEAEVHFKRLYPGKSLYVWDGNVQKWSGGKPPGVYTWAEVDEAKAKQERQK